MMGRLPKSPYQGKDERELSRASSDISFEDKRLIYTFCAASGIHNRMIQILYHAMAEDCARYLKTNPHATLNEREQYLFECLSRRSAAELTSSEPKSNESGGPAKRNRSTPRGGNVKAKAGDKVGGRGGSQEEGKEGSDATQG
jgi:hypothetical protein